MKCLVLNFIRWSGIHHDIEDFARHYTICVTLKNNPPKVDTRN